MNIIPKNWNSEAEETNELQKFSRLVYFHHTYLLDSLCAQKKSICFLYNKKKKRAEKIVSCFVCWLQLTNS